MSAGAPSPATTARPSRLAAAALRGAIRGYQWTISPLLGPHCRFSPTCSAYAHEAIGMHGAWRGIRLALGRIARCHPFHPGGLDPVPSPRAAGDPAATTRRS